MWKLKELVEGVMCVQNVLKLKEKFEGCCDFVLGILQIDVGVVMFGFDVIVDIVFVFDFVDKVVFDVYQVYLVYQEVKKFVVVVVELCECVDYIVDNV